MKNESNDEFARKVREYDKRPPSEEEVLYRKSSLEDLRSILDKGEEQSVATPVDQLPGASSN
jgi:hypothetical protein